MNTLYLRLPSAAGIDNASVHASLTCCFALASHQGTIARSGEASLSALAATIAGADRVVLLLAAADVTLLSIKAPPLSAGRLKLALPSLVEEYILDDPEDCIIVTGPSVDGMLPVAVMRRSRLQTFADVCLQLGARKLQAWPLQACLRQMQQQQGCVAVLHEYMDETRGGTLELCLHLPPHSALGLSLHAADSDSGAHEVLRTLRLLSPQDPITLMVPSQRANAYRQIADAGIDVEADDWSKWITRELSDAHSVPDMMKTLATTGSRSNLRAWRRPLQLTVLILLLNIVALNIDWWHLRREADALKTDMTQTYRTRFPDERVILDPLLQMQQKIAAARRAAGEPAPDDFIALAADFAAAWNGLQSPAGSAVIASLDYRERSLLLRLKPQAIADDQSDNFQQQLQAALARRKLSLQQGAADAWQIRRAP